MIKRKKKRKNPVTLSDLNITKTVYYKNKPFIVSKIRTGGIVEIISEDGNIKHTVNMNDLTLENKESFKKKYGFSKLDEPEFILLDRYIISEKENSKLKGTGLYLDFMIFTELNADRQPILKKGWVFDGSVESSKTKKPVDFFSSKISYDKRGDAFMAAKRMIEEKYKIHVPYSLLPYEENKIVKI